MPMLKVTNPEVTKSPPPKITPAPSVNNEYDAPDITIAAPPSIVIPPANFSFVGVLYHTPSLPFLSMNLTGFA